jgi:hypothetical protein
VRCAALRCWLVADPAVVLCAVHAVQKYSRQYLTNELNLLMRVKGRKNVMEICGLYAVPLDNPIDLANANAATAAASAAKARAAGATDSSTAVTTAPPAEAVEYWRGLPRHEEIALLEYCVRAT